MNLDRLWAVWRLLRDVTLFGSGLGLVVHEAAFKTGSVDYGLLMLYAGMLGLPVFLRADERRKDEPSPTPEPEP